ncbi:2-dehydro-3-deoxygalactonokinase [Paracidovorax citrulli]|uniref:2-keto-3-deoxygalactonate kinase n=2 Tax=Paracidovorax citrulli TaxID=80869 RepID=A1TPD6_PARC0|nr:2-dehydro-3-deoxygalactonokinase [Paracidovorax citrulli]ABM32824.1 2-keto-3-deoxygalactonate kinase [Paracidovorax citrulli AAC00-1]ATG93189.1 2-dehydro-3-deoxygalactonokinase [Paracidovorax citrulli]PVY67041.1 2-keto-3-deoxygalactonate kinase [Paracidovorax citrulli]QCX12889.1 putative 2-dehydro-3-deoxygalactonokinase DgoK1 [Paracidovorax citrulli]REG68796.1 2-keto-3-deoxygalactonate kinase [Paracidovorax citrulli]
MNDHAADLQATRLVALDWGTSSLRAYRLGDGGRVLELRHRPWGIMHLPPAPAGTDAGTDAAFERALQDACGDWLAAAPHLPLLACGMVGSAQGWRDARYLHTPASLDALAQGLTRVERPGGQPLHIVPGLLQPGELPNVMRGEETQVLGVLALRPAEDAGPWLVGLPGSHSKWVVAQRGGIEGFHTFMTGEVFAALRGHTILGRTMAPAGAQDGAAPQDAAFLRGLEVACGSDAGLGLLSHIFSTRTLGLTGVLPASAQADYLSGLLIGHEVAALARVHPPGSAAAPVQPLLCGEPDLCRRYALALRLQGFAEPAIAAQATPTGLWQIARAAGLPAPDAPQPSSAESLAA